MNWKDELRELRYQHHVNRYPQAAKDGQLEYVKKHCYKANNANSLTACICDWINFTGGCATRINTTGTMRRIKGEMKWTKGGTRRGTADIHAIIRGRHVSIEVKYGKDKISEDQIKERERIESAGGIYYIAQSMESFTEWYNENFITEK